ncbi:transmembrane protein 241 isoform X2 [Leucoraja erinacea]|uniref:transmembrane protein 241 isoform X2 n=1 Tax=Leucoraja erinaceus TaxID=7782 RepID=UPI00245555A3|nr:transmembrane protein 241 isoform X2 [Leucoraja erinacea]
MTAWAGSRPLATCRRHSLTSTSIPAIAHNSSHRRRLGHSPSPQPRQMWHEWLQLCFSLSLLISPASWQTIVGTVLLQVAWKLGWVELRSSFLWSAKISWLPGVLLFVGSIYAGSRALSKLPIPFFLLLQTASDVAGNITLKIVTKEKLSCTKISSTLMIFAASATLMLTIIESESDGVYWGVLHVACAGGYKVFQKLKPCSLSVVILICAAYPSGDAFDVLAFPFLYSYHFHWGCCASGILGIILHLVSVKLKTCVSTVRYGAWTLVTKVLAACLSLAVFETLLNTRTSCCLMLGVFGEALLVYTSVSEPQANG